MCALFCLNHASRRFGRSCEWKCIARCAQRVMKVAFFSSRAVCVGRRASYYNCQHSCDSHSHSGECGSAIRITGPTTIYYVRTPSALRSLCCECIARCEQCVQCVGPPARWGSCNNHPFASYLAPKLVDLFISEKSCALNIKKFFAVQNKIFCL
jgi:hypothetical protein